MNDITWNDLPKAVLKLSNQVERIERLLLQNGVHHPEPECWFDLNQLCNYLPEKPAKATVYGWVHRGQVPYHKGGKRLRFLKSEIDTWLLKGKEQNLGTNNPSTLLAWGRM